MLSQKQIAENRKFVVRQFPVPVCRRINSVTDDGKSELSFYMELDFTEGMIFTGNALTSCFDQTHTLEQINDNTY